MFFPKETSSVREGREVIENLYYFHENPMLDCNQYIINDPSNEEISLFDAGNGISLNGLIKGMNELNLDFQKIKYIYITHEHVDHVLGLYPIMKLLKEVPPIIFAYGDTAEILREGNEIKIFPGNLGIRPSMFGVEIIPLNIKELSKEKQIQIGSNFSFQIFYTPGHSLGSISFYEPERKILIPGDLVFTGGSFGRYDFPGGSLEILTESIKYVNDLDVQYLLPGHMGISDDGNQQIALSYRMVQSIQNFF